MMTDMIFTILGAFIVGTFLALLFHEPEPEEKKRKKKQEPITPPRKSTLNEDEEAKQTGLGINEMRLFMAPLPPPKIKSDEDVFTEVEQVIKKFEL